MKDVHTIVFDKTGTITKGKPEVTDIIGNNKFKEKDILYFASSIEKGSEHPLAKAIIETAKKKGIKLDKVTNFKAISGKGIMGRVAGKKVAVGNQKLMKDLGVDFKGDRKSVV